MKRTILKSSSLKSIKALYIVALLWIGLWMGIRARAEINSLPAEAKASMMTGLYSERSEIGDRIEVRLIEPLNLRDQRTFIPLGSVFSGEVVDVEEAKIGLRKGKVKVVFHTIHFPNGYFLRTESYLTNDKRFLLGLEKQELEHEDEVKGETSWGQKVFRAGKVGAGALLGGPIGAAAASGVLIFDKGGKVRIKPGDEVEIYVREISPAFDVQGELIANPPRPIAP
ncbi:MAG: hypothetical protein SFT81_00265 [Candidatus Caenarcaniphilales bacterium]|nr:hypothetical protein [Candidatus Caenarcaniphilales bacterium]